MMMMTVMITRMMMMVEDDDDDYSSGGGGSNNNNDNISKQGTNMQPDYPQQTKGLLRTEAEVTVVSDQFAC